MDFIQIGLIFLIIILGIFLSLTGLQVFYILRDLKKTLNGLNDILFGDGEAAEKIKQSAKKNVSSSRRFFKR